MATDATSARNKMLDTTELLENVMLNLPPHDIHNAKRVSKTWKALYDTCTNIRLAGVITPLIGRMHPTYEETTDIGLLPRTWEYCYYLRDHCIFVSDLDRATVADLMDCYVISPPCCTVGMSVAFGPSFLHDVDPRDRSYMQCGVYAPSGVRFKDNFHVFDVLVEQAKAMKSGTVLEEMRAHVCGEFNFCGIALLGSKVASQLHVREWVAR